MKRKKKEVAEETKVVVMKAVSYQYMSYLYGAVQFFVILLSKEVAFFPGADIIQSIVGTLAEIVAGLYGITMANYTFFLSRMDGLMASDATLSWIVTSIKQRYKSLAWIVTVNVLVMLFISMLLMYIPAPEGGNLAYFYRLFCNEFILSVALSLGMILYYSLMVVNPNCIEKEAKKLKKKICRETRMDGSATEFIMLYDQIEETCNAMIPQSVLRQVWENKGNQFAYTIELMKELPMDVKLILPSIEQVHMYYECVINCKELRVSQAMCDKAKWVLQVINKK